MFMSLLTEGISYHFIYRHEEYQDLIERTRNLGKKMKELNNALLYGTSGSAGSTKRKQNERMLKVHETNYKEYHR